MFCVSPPSRITYVFYEQYLTIVNEGLFNISLCLLPTFVVCCLLLGLDLRSGLLNLLTIVMIVVDTVGVMTLWSIDYNAVALINLVTVRANQIIGTEGGSFSQVWTQLWKDIVLTSLPNNRCWLAASLGFFRDQPIQSTECGYFY